MKNIDPIKKILSNSTDGASPQFLQSVMKRVKQKATYAPLVPATIRKHFLLIFGTVTAAIVIICLLVLISGTPLPTWFANLHLEEWEAQQTFYFILLFSVMSAGYFWVQYRSAKKE